MRRHQRFAIAAFVILSIALISVTLVGVGRRSVIALSATNACKSITLGAPVSFVDVEDDHNVAQPPVPPVGWDKTSQFVLLSDGWDVWKVPAAGGAAVNLTGNGRKDAIRYQGRLRLDPDEKGIDLSVPQYFNTYGEWTKKSGIARLAPGKTGAESLLWDAVGYGRVGKAKNADRIIYSRETSTEAPELYASDSSFKAGAKLTDPFEGGCSRTRLIHRDLAGVVPERHHSRCQHGAVEQDTDQDGRVRPTNESRVRTAPVHGVGIS